MNLVKATTEPFDLLPIIHTLTRELLSVSDLTLSVLYVFINIVVCSKVDICSSAYCVLLGHSCIQCVLYE